MKKKLFAIALAVLLPIALLAGSGDVNGDGKINAADIVELVNYLDGHQSEKFKTSEADVNFDGNITWDDVDDLADIIMLGDNYIKVYPKTITISNDKQEFDVYMKTDLDANSILVDVENNDDMGLFSPNGKEDTEEEGVYKWHFMTSGNPTNYTGNDWEAKVYLYHQDLDVRDYVNVVFESADPPTLTVSPNKIELENKQYERRTYVDLDYNYDWVMYEPEFTVLNYKDNTELSGDDKWITRVWNEDKKLGLEYEENYTAETRRAKVVVKSLRCDIADTLYVSIESGGLAKLSVSPKEVTVRNKEYGRNIILSLDRNPKWLEFEAKFEGDDETWLVPANYDILEGDDGSQQILFEYSQNFTGKDRVGKIVLTNKKYNLEETITVTSQCADWVEILPDDLPDRWVRAQKREYNLIGIGSENAKKLDFDMVLRTGGIEDQNDIGCEIIGENTDWLELGPITILGCYFSYARNESNEVKTAKVRLYDKNGTYSDEVTVNSLPINFMNVNDQNHIYIQPDGDEIDFVLYGGATREVTPEMEDNIFTDTDILNSCNGKYKPFIHHISNEVVGNDLHIKLKIDPNTTEEHRWQYVNFPVRYTEECQKLYIGQAPKTAPSATEMRQALTDLYNSTNGDNWYRHKNWNTDEPLSQWEHLSLAGLGDYVWACDLNGNTLIGTIPESFGTVMEIENTWRIDHNGLYGKIPDAVINHPKWQEKGWNVVVQDLFCSSRRLLEYDDLKLKLPTFEIDHVNGNLKTSDELFAKHKINVVMIGKPSMAMGNLHLAYHNKGYGTIVSSYDWLGGKREDSEALVEEFPIKDIDYVWKCDWANKELFGLRTMGTWYVFDDKANLLACYVRDWDIPDEWYAAQVEAICRKYLGDPEEHDAYSYYTSTDYSKDGEVKRLQQATEGNGIDIVFLGECFIDKDMAEGGEYDKQIQEAVKQFFSEEPYKSLRERFNVWQVKVVSPNEEYASDAVHAINYDDAKAFEYARKALGNDAKRMMVNVIWKGGIGPTLLDVNRSYTSMYEADGSYVAYNLQGGRVINHEGGGHGVALLLDEYVEGGWEDASPDTDAKNELDQFYERSGGGANVDWRSNPAEVKWAKFINDDRYAAEGIGVYEGSWLYGKGAYRPTENSMMRYNDCGFNAPSREAIYKRVMKLSEDDTWSYDYETFVTFDTPAREAYKAAQSRSRARQAEGDVQQKRIESRPPTIYKGTWRDAGKCEKVEYTSKP